MSPLELGQFRLIGELKKEISMLQGRQSRQCAEQSRLLAFNQELQEKLIRWREVEIDQQDDLMLQVADLRMQVASANAIADERQTSLADARRQLSRVLFQLFVLLAAALIFALFR